MNLLPQTLSTAAFALLIGGQAFAQTTPFEYRVYQAGLRAAAAPVPEEETTPPPAPEAPPEIPDPHIADVQSLLHMDAFSGSGPLDQKGNGWAGQNVSIVGAPKFGTGALAFTQTNSWVEGPVLTPYVNYTIDVWVNPSVTSGVRPVVAHWGDAANQKHFLLAIDNGVPRFRYTNMVNISGGSAPAGTWTHLAVMIRNSAYYLYVNGVQVTNMGTTGASPNGTVRATLGNTYNSSGTMGGAGMTSFQGLMDDVRITRTPRYLETTGYRGALQSFPVPDRAYTNP